MPKKKKKCSVNALAIAVSVVFVVIVMAILLLFIINKWTLNIKINGEQNLTVEMNEKYKDMGAEATVFGSVFFKTPHKLDVNTKGSVNTSKPGKKFTVEYSAKFLWYTQKAKRTVTVTESVPPVIELVRKPGSYTLPGKEYKEEGYKAFDNIDGDITKSVERKVEKGKVIYTVKDSSGNVATVERKIVYKDPVAPKIELKGDTEIVINAGTEYCEPGFTAKDNVDGNITSKVTVDNTVNVYIAGTYDITYSVSDKAGNVASAKRTVIVKALPKTNPTPPPQNKKQSKSANVPGKKNIYLTFDDGPSQFTPELLDILARYNVKATFFVINANPDTIAREYREGHSVGIHTASHDYGRIYSSESAYFDDMNQVQKLIQSKTGAKTSLMRFPGGSSNTVSSFNPGIMTRLTKAVTDAGYQYFDWNVSSGDAGETTSTQQVFENIVNGVNGNENSVVLQHDTKKFSIDAVESVINWGLSNGYTFLPLTVSSPGMHHGINN